MKNFTLILLLLFAFSGNLECQEYFVEGIEEEPRMTLKTNPLSMIQGPIFLCSEYRLCYERLIKPGQSMQVSVSYLGKSYYVILSEAMMDDPYHFKISGMRFTAEYRLFHTMLWGKKNALKGLYAAPYISWASAKISDDYSMTFNEYIKATYQNYCLKTGYQTIKGKFVLDFFVGIGYRNNVWTEHRNYNFSVLDNDDLEIFPGHLKLLAGFNAGMTF